MSETHLKILTAIAPAIVLAIILIRKDKRPEPIKWLLAATGLGVLVAPAVLLLSYIGLPDIEVNNTFTGAFLTSFISAAIPEEGLKFIALYILASKCKYFDEIFDGIVYAVCIGMGFAGIENILYLFSAEESWLSVGISRAMLSVPAHYAFAIIMGAFFSVGWFNRGNRFIYLSAALLLPIIVHGLYDTLCFSMGIDENFSFIILVAFILGFNYVRKFVRNLTVAMLQIDDSATE